MSDQQEKKEAPSLGLSGVWASVANLSATALMALILYQGFHAGLESLREERKLCRDAIGRVELACERLAGEVRRLVDRVERKPGVSALPPCGCTEGGKCDCGPGCRCPRPIVMEARP